VSGLHVAVIMDGNGRWAQARGLPRVEGHLVGVEALRRTVEASPALGISTLSAYAFSADNWKRPRSEVNGLFGLFRSYLEGELAALVDAGVRLTVIGRRDRLEGSLVRAIERAEDATTSCRRLHFRLAIDYSARDAITRAALESGVDGLVTRERVGQRVGSGDGRLANVPDVDLLIRTGGEQRLSDFLLWECAYAELWFTQTMWPDFGATDLARAVEEFKRRDRRFGGVDVRQPQRQGEHGARTENDLDLILPNSVRPL
jgi:undecaprenyl diphosphate synthase